MTQNDNVASESTQDEILASILQKITPPPTPPPPSSSDGGDILSSLLSNPELIGKLPAILSTIKPILDMLKATSGTSAAVSSPVSAPVSAPVSEADPESTTPKDVPAALVNHSPGADSRTALLCAMKPYLGRDRQNAIDYIVKIGKLGDILKTL
ncbi:MAG: hypothetical protein IKJ24_05020 [Clostridia bacterium]|nr:hypothetical protein [Clostridia bacterium]